MTEMRKYWATMSGRRALVMMEVLQSLEADLRNLEIDTSGFP